MCGRTYQKTRTDEEAMAETARVFAEDFKLGEDVELAVVCHDCYQKVKPALEA
jgi:hypothetical protein